MISPVKMIGKSACFRDCKSNFYSPENLIKKGIFWVYFYSQVDNFPAENQGWINNSLFGENGMQFSVIKRVLTCSDDHLHPVTKE
jgi:hypothetical protein